MNIPLPKVRVPELRSKIQQFQNEIIGWSMEFKDNEELAQLGTSLMIFPDDSGEPEGGASLD